MPSSDSLVLLAGGRSSRLGTPKGLVRVEGRPWIAHQLDAADRAGLRVIAVLGFDHSRYAAELPELASRAVVVVNPLPERGPFSSLQCGLALVGAGRAFVLPIDVPAPDAPVWRALRGALTEGFDAAVPVHDGHGGHPVLLSARMVERLLRLESASRLDVELRASAVARVAVADARVLMNLNSPEEWIAAGAEPAT
ncbi:MAG TPA: nucleotidyltransferase family protein [Polyangiaceae bacterium]|nr:nucleotidyltransferase family protein [Polyangiaceae bacterium]